MPGAIHVRLIASMEHRVKDVMEKDLLSEKQAVKKIREVDAERALFMKKQHNFDIQDLSRFDLVWNLDRIRVPEMVNTMAELIHLRLQHLRKTGAIYAR
jgi:cytidylate kinase